MSTQHDRQDNSHTELEAEIEALKQALSKLELAIELLG